MKITNRETEPTERNIHRPMFSRMGAPLIKCMTRCVILSSPLGLGCPYARWDRRIAPAVAIFQTSIPAATVFLASVRISTPVQHHGKMGQGDRFADGCPPTIGIGRQALEEWGMLRGAIARHCLEALPQTADQVRSEAAAPVRLDCVPAQFIFPA